MVATAVVGFRAVGCLCYAPLTASERRMDTQVYSLIHGLGVALVAALPSTLVGIALLRGQQHIRNENAVICYDIAW